MFPDLVEPICPGLVGWSAQQVHQVGKMAAHQVADVAAGTLMGIQHIGRGRVVEKIVVIDLGKVRRALGEQGMIGGENTLFILADLEDVIVFPRLRQVCGTPAIARPLHPPPVFDGSRHELYVSYCCTAVR